MNSVEEKNESIIPFYFYFNGVLIRGYRVFNRGDRVPFLWKNNYYLIKDLVKVLKSNPFDDVDRIPVYVDRQNSSVFCVEHQRLLNILIRNYVDENIFSDVDELCLSLMSNIPRFDLYALLK